MEWRFKQLTRNDTLQNASHLEFFHNEALQSAVDALAREDIQNRLDARGWNEPRVEVRYRLCGPVAAGRHDARFNGLAPHLGSPQIKEELGSQPSLQRPLQWLVVGRFDDSTHAYFATPETDSATLDRFATDFGLTRKNDEPGLSLVIPWPEADITMDALIRSLVEHWFWVILEDRLIGVLAMVKAGDLPNDARGTLLGDAENPAHGAAVYGRN